MPRSPWQPGGPFGTQRGPTACCVSARGSSSPPCRCHCPHLRAFAASTAVPISFENRHLEITCPRPVIRSGAWDMTPSISYGHTCSRGLKRANITLSLKKDTWSEQRDSNCQSEVQVSGSECQMVAHSDCSKMGILCAGRGAQTQILIRWIVNAETLIAIFIDHPPLLASCCGNSEA